MFKFIPVFEARQRLVLRPCCSLALAALFVLIGSGLRAMGETSFQQKLKALPFKIAYECYLDDNWEIFVMDADGSNPVNLTKTTKEHEHYPQVSPDGTK